MAPYSSKSNTLEQPSFSLDIWKFAAPYLNLKLSRDLWSSTKLVFLDTCGKSFSPFLIFCVHNRAVNWSSNTLELLPSNIAKYFVSSFWSKQENKRTLKLSAWVIHLVQLPDFYFLKYELRIHPLSQPRPRPRLRTVGLMVFGLILQKICVQNIKADCSDLKKKFWE